MSRIGKINVTRDYGMFFNDLENRPLNPKKHKKLRSSMERYGFLKSFPLVCRRDGVGRIVVKDGQHRLMIAQELNLEVHWVEEDVDFDIAIVNSTACTWGLADYAEKHAKNGIEDYADGLAFAKAHGLPLGTAFALLAGNTCFSNIEDDFKSGDFRVKDRKWADAVAGIYAPMVSMSAALRTARFIEACMAVCRVKTFEPKRLLQGSDRCRDKLVSYSTRDAYLDMIETVYNFGRKQMASLKNEAIMAMRARNPKSKGAKEEAA